jgi:hypothetical protein
MEKGTHDSVLRLHTQNIPLLAGSGVATTHYPTTEAPLASPILQGTPRNLNNSELPGGCHDRCWNREQRDLRLLIWRYLQSEHCRHRSSSSPSGSNIPEDEELVGGFFEALNERPQPSLFFVDMFRLAWSIEEEVPRGHL